MMASDSDLARERSFGIVAMEIYFPHYYVSQTELEKFDGVSVGKYTVGLGQKRMAVCPPGEDIQSMCLTALESLMTKYSIPYERIGRLEVGTETFVDGSKSIKSVLMQLFNRHGVYDVEGVDVKNACYGGTAALFSTLAWMESSAWDGRLGIVVAGDIATYAPGPARPTGGAGVVVMLVGPNAPLVLDPASPFPVVDGQLSISTYFDSLLSCYRGLKRKSTGTTSLSDFDFLVFHAPFGKLVQKSVSRLLHEDADCVDEYAAVQDRFMKEGVPVFVTKSLPSLLCSAELGNTYCGSLYFGLLSLVESVADQNLVLMWI